MRAPTAVPRLRDYGRHLLTRWVLIGVVAMLSAGAAVAAGSAAPHEYEATSRLLATTSGAAGTRYDLEGNRAAVTRTADYAALVTSTLVLRRTELALRGEADVAEIEAALSTSIPDRSALLDITATHVDRDLAERISAEVAGQMVALAQELEWSEADDGPAAELRPIDVATSVDGAAPSPVALAAVGALLGLVLASLATIARGIARDVPLSRDEVGHVVATARGGGRR